jgi:hypothetical protein
MIRKFPFQWIPGDWREKGHGQLFVLDMNPEKVGLHISIDERWNKNSGVLREVIDPAVMHIRHGFKETLDENGKLVESPTVIHDMMSVKKHFRHWKEHIRLFEEEHSDKKVLAFSSNGNCGSNPYYVASDGKNHLYLKTEKEPMLTGRTYSFINSDTISIHHEREMKSYNENMNEWELNSIWFRSQFATGIPLVQSGVPLDRSGLTMLVQEGKIYDLGHMFRFGYIKYKESWVNLGYNGFFTDGKLDFEKVAAGVSRKVVEGIDIGVFAEDEARKSMEAKGYKFVAKPRSGHAGEFTIKDGKMDVVFLSGIYPHSMLGLTKDGRMISAAIRALGNRAGGTDYLGAAEIMAWLGCQNAILCDNGGDTVNGFATGEFFTQTEEPNRGLRSVFLYYVERDKNIAPDDMRAVIYPPQYPS